MPESDSSPNSLTARCQAMRFNFAELSGALGDLGTFVPIVVVLVANCRLDIGSVLFFAGLYNIITGVLFNQPIPVQPMKAIAAVAIAESLSPGTIAAAGFSAGLLVLFLGLSGLIETVDRLVPRPVVRGIQLGVGLKLLVKGIVMIHGTPLWAFDSIGVAIIAAIFVLFSSRRPRLPSALFLFVAGIGIMLATQPILLRQLSFGWGGLHWLLPTAAEWQTGILRGTLPQLPLTVLNSVIAVCALSADLYPGRGIKQRAMATSVGLMNICGCFLGAMPMCHGSGGLAGQYHFGGRTGGSVVMLGMAKILIAVCLGSSAAILLAAYPASILGVLLCFAGLELSLPARACTQRDDFFLATLTAGGILGANTAVGFGLGIFAAFFLSSKGSSKE